MQHADTIVISDDIRRAVAGLLERLGPATVVASAKWRPLADALGLSEGPDEGAADVQDRTLLVGSTADVLKHAAARDHNGKPPEPETPEPETAEFGFIVPVAQSTRPWQKSPSWRDETTLELWAIGWTPVAIDRVTTSKQDATVEFVIGNARPTPQQPPRVPAPAESI